MHQARHQRHPDGQVDPPWLERCWELLVENLDAAYLGMPVLLDRDTTQFEECSIGVFVEMLSGNVAVVNLTGEKKSRKSRIGVIPIELLLLPSLDDRYDEDSEYTRCYNRLFSTC